jgi:NAD(P)-dependent dehydrogenase (short-subunit alcohol dehydrogenase family)
VAKHVLPLVPKAGKNVFAILSARVGSIEDNRLGGWYGYRASKAGLNQFVRTLAIELGRQRPEAMCVALHPGTGRYSSEPSLSGRHQEGVLTGLFCRAAAGCYERLDGGGLWSILCLGWPTNTLLTENIRPFLHDFQGCPRVKLSS